MLREYCPSWLSMYFCQWVKSGCCINVDPQCRVRGARPVTSVMSDSQWSCEPQPTRLLCPWDSPGKNTGVGCHALLQGIFLTQGSNLCLLYLLHCRWILYPLSHQGVERIPKGREEFFYVYIFLVLPQKMNFISQTLMRKTLGWQRNYFSPWIVVAGLPFWK